eukprot:c23786_g1_i1 orf=87-809(+)
MLLRGCCIRGSEFMRLLTHSSLPASLPAPCHASNKALQLMDLQAQAGKKWTQLSARGSTFCKGYFSLAPKSLDSILPVDRVSNATPEELTNMWNELHIGRGHVSAVLGREHFGILQHRANACPMFVIPLQREKGYVSFFLQVQMPHMLLTGLEDYKIQGIKASPYFTATHYSEFTESKGLTLVHGDIILPSKLSDMEAEQLLEIAHSFYLIDSRYKLVQQFNKQSEEFEFRDVLQELGIP